jgi:uncharacterized protein
MRATHFILSFLLLLAAIPGGAQDHAVPQQPNTVYVGADGKFEAAADTAKIEFNVSVQDDSSQKAFERASKNVEQVREVLRSNGIEPKAAMVGSLSVQPVYDWKPKQHVVGYRVSTDVTLKLKDFAKVGPVTQQLADANVSETQTLNYTLENIDEAKNKAVEDAYRRARSLGEALARASGKTLGDLLSASIDVSEEQRRIPRFAMAAQAQVHATPAPTEEFTPQTVTVNAHVNALFNLK